MESIFDVLRQYPALQQISIIILVLSLSAFAYLLIEYLNKQDRREEEVVLPKPKVRVIVREGQAVPVNSREEIVSAAVSMETRVLEPVSAPVAEPVALPVNESVSTPVQGLYIPPEYRIEPPVETKGPLVETPLPPAPVKKIVLPSMPEDTPVLLRAPALPVKQAPKQPITPLPTPEIKRPQQKTEPETVTPHKEEQTSVAHIGYDPLNLFEQTEPLSYPYVLMPKPGSVIKFPRKGKAGRRGFAEEGFKSYLKHFFSHAFQVHDDHFVLTRRSYQPYGPDLMLVDEKNGLNLFMDIEIDEPYEDSNAISKREVTHYQYADNNANNALVNRGWIVVRFAEIQVHQQPESCCLFIAHLVKSLCPSFEIPEIVLTNTPLAPLKQWTKEQAQQWSKQKYREAYLGIASFESFRETISLVPAKETKLGKEIEQKVQDEEPFYEPEPLDVSTPSAITTLIHSVIENSQYISFVYEDKPCLVKPWIIIGSRLKAYCYIKNENREFDVSHLKEIGIKDKPFIVEIKGAAVGVEKMGWMVNVAIHYHRFVRIRYTRANWTGYLIDESTGDVMLDEAEAAESLRTISHPGLTGKTFEEYAHPLLTETDCLKAWCHKENWQEVFRFNRICEMAILNL